MKFSKNNRLVTKSDYQFVFDQPSKSTQQYLQLFYRTNTVGHPRLGIIINKSHTPRAVDRNRLRRMIRESFRAHIADIKAVDIIVFVRKGWEKDNKVFRSQTDNLWLKIS